MGMVVAIKIIRYENAISGIYMFVLSRLTKKCIKINLSIHLLYTLYTLFIHFVYIFYLEGIIILF